MHNEFTQAPCDSLEQVRQQIDHLDQAFIELIAARQFYVDQAARFKQNAQEARAPGRVEQIIAQVRQRAVDQDVDPDLIEQMYRAMIQHFIVRELRHIGA